MGLPAHVTLISVKQFFTVRSERGETRPEYRPIQLPLLLFLAIISKLHTSINFTFRFMMANNLWDLARAPFCPLNHRMRVR